MTIISHNQALNHQNPTPNDNTLYSIPVWIRTRRRSGGGRRMSSCEIALRRWWDWDLIREVFGGVVNFLLLMMGFLRERKGENCDVWLAFTRRWDDEKEILDLRVVDIVLRIIKARTVNSHDMFPKKTQHLARLHSKNQRELTLTLKFT